MNESLVTIPTQLCPLCLSPCDVATERQPRESDVLICVECYGLLVVEDGVFKPLLSAKRLTLEQVQFIPVVIAAVQRKKAQLKAMQN